MRFKMTRLLALIIPSFIALLLTGCFGSGSNTPTYDGTWTATVADSSFTPPCTLPPTLPTVTLVDGAGSTRQINSCTTGQFLYLISVSITTSTGVVKAVVNGTTLTGQCVSAVGCGAQGGTLSLALTR